MIKSSWEVKWEVVGVYIHVPDEQVVVVYGCGDGHAVVAAVVVVDDDDVRRGGVGGSVRHVAAVAVDTEGWGFAAPPPPGYAGSFVSGSTLVDRLAEWSWNRIDPNYQSWTSV